MRVRLGRIFVCFLSIGALFIGINSDSAFAQEHLYSWGKASFNKTSSGTNLRLVFWPQTLDSAKGGALHCYVKVSSPSNISLQMKRHVGHPISSTNPNNNAVAEFLKKNLKASSSSMVSFKGYRWFRGNRLADISITPLTVEGQSLTALDTLDLLVTGNIEFAATEKTSDKQFESILNALVANAAAATSTDTLVWADSTKRWIPDNGEAIKLTIPGNGLYRLSYSDLASVAPVLLAANPSTIRLISKGKELPLYVHTNASSVWSAGDYLEFVGTKNYNQDTLYRIIPTGEQEYTEYLNRYTDTSYYWLVWGGTAGKRFDTTTTAASPTDTVRWYTETVHLEQNNLYAYCGSDAMEQQNPFWTPGDIWGWEVLYAVSASSEADVSFTASDLQSNACTPRLLVKVASNYASSGYYHVLNAGINSYLGSDTTLLAPFAQTILRRSIPLSSLNEGTNTVKLFSYLTTSSVNGVLLDWVEVEYPRTLIATNDSLWFRFRDLSGSSVRRVMLQGLTTTDVAVYKTGSNPKKISGTFSGTGTFVFSFVDTVQNGDQYLVVSTANIQKPGFAYKSAFANLRSSSRSAEYLMVTDTPFFSLAKTYTTLIQSQYSLTPAIISIQDIYDEFSYGYAVPEAIREFAKGTTKWAAMPSYLVFVGKANYDYKNYLGIAASSYVHNTVPAYGMPVSDPYAAVLDDSLWIPQMYVGRIPALNPDEFQTYVTRLSSYVTQSYTDWNKRYIFFAGGSSSSEYDVFHNVNTDLINNRVAPAPIGGLTADFYKSTTYVSGFGAYTTAQAANIIDSSAIMITYVGHSGTETWDNNINTVADLANTVGRYPLISDYGCSTAKFAEPNIRSFSEQFTVGSSGSAIGYMGNSSLGFVSIAETFPTYFFEQVFADSTHTVGKDYLLAKIEAVNDTWGTASVFSRQLMLTNTLMGDPAVELPIPKLSNLTITADHIISSPSLPSDDNDSLALTIPYHNWGYVPTDTFTVSIQHSYLTSTTTTTLIKSVPLYADTLHLSYPIRNNPGTHTFTITLNPSHALNEMSYTDNTCNYSVAVQSSAFRVVYPVPGLNAPPKKFTLLNPVKQTSDTGQITLQIDTSSAFSHPLTYTASRGMVVTSFTPAAKNAERYYWRAFSAKSDSVSGSYIPSSDTSMHWSQTLSAQWSSENTYNNTIYNVSHCQLDTLLTYTFYFASGGGNNAHWAKLRINNNDILVSGVRGLYAVQLDTLDFHLIQSVMFDTFHDTAQSELLASFLTALPERSLVAMLVSDEASNHLTQTTRNIIKTFGSQYIDQLSWRRPWILFGQKGDASGSALEELGASADTISLDTTIYRPALSGTVLSPSFGPASQWTKATISKTTPAGSSLGMYVLGTTLAGSTDTLVSNDSSSSISLTSINPKKYRSLQLLAKFTANAVGATPVLNNWNVLLQPPPELAINYQCVTTTADTLQEGKTLGVTAKIYNAGESEADSIKVVMTQINSGIRWQDTVLVSSIPADSFATVNFSVPTTGSEGINTGLITIDPEEKIPEIYTVNNSYSFTFYVQTDTTRPTLNITFDGRRILNNDYVLAKPNIKIVMYDNSALAVTNPSNIQMSLDGRTVTLGTATPDSLFTSMGTGTEKATVEYHPSLSTGTHILSIRAKDASGNYSDSLSTDVTFRVETEAKLLNVYNYPNPFGTETFFTFDVTGESVPDEVHIKIYTIAGRLIQDLYVPQSALYGGFNKVYWNGKDRNGDSIANGVYFYKVLSKIGGKNVEVIQKLAKVR